MIRQRPSSTGSAGVHAIWLAPILGLVLFRASLSAAVDVAPPVRVPEGFTVSLVADDDLAADVTAMTIDHKGRVVVAGRGYIKTLHDDDGDGRADRAVVFATGPDGGAQGLVVQPRTEGYAVVAGGGVGVTLYRDDDDDGVADADGGTVLHLADGPRGVHGICRGPDGHYYIAYGNGAHRSDFSSATVGSYITTQLGGAVLRTSFPTDGPVLQAPSLEVVAWGFDNPYDLDFHCSGRLMLADVDREREFGLPSYAPARLYDIAWGRDHGRIAADNGQSWTRPESFFDAVRSAGTFGRAAPTGLVAYRHRAFPRRFRDGVFTACWMSGRVFFSPLKQAGATFTAAPETFLEVTGDAGFTPIDLAVGPAGDLFVACGGRGARGAVWRVRYKGTKDVPPADDAPPPATLRQVLQADQPLAAWSRANWVRQSLWLGRKAFVDAIADPNLPVEEQVRAVEILAEMFASVTLAEARAAIALNRPELSARIAWIVERQRVSVSWSDVLCELTRDEDPRVQLAAWEGLRRSSSLLPRLGAHYPDWIKATAPTVERRIYDLLVQYRIQMPPPPLKTATQNVDDHRQREAYDQFQSRETFAYTAVEFSPAAAVDVQLRQLRQIQKFYGDFAVLNATPLEVGYRRQLSTTVAAVNGPLLTQLSMSFPTGNDEVDRELARTWLVFPELPPHMLGQFFLNQCTPTSSPTADVHYLIAAAAFVQPRLPHQTQKVAQTLLRLDAKFAAAGIRPGADWPARLGELFELLAARDLDLPAELAAAEEFGRPEHALFVARMPEDVRERAGDWLVEAVLKLPPDEVAWTPELISLFSSARRDGAIVRLRGLWKEPGLRDLLLPALLKDRRLEDRDKFVDRLTGTDPEVVARAAVALRRPVANRDEAGELAAAVRGLRQMCTVPDARRARRELWTLIEVWGRTTFEIEEPPSDSVRSANPAAFREAYQPVFLWFALKHYMAAAEAASPDGVDPGAWRKQLLLVDWEQGDVRRGRTLFEKKLCVRCHTGDSRLGPNLDEAVARYGRSELFATIFEPSRFVPARYRPTTVELDDGRNYTGIPLAESGDLLLLQTGADTTVRVRVAEIEARRTTTQSIMPLGMLNDFSSQDFADLNAYLLTLAGR